MILSDNETKIDLLNNEAIALTIIKLLHERKDNPITIGVHGDWGAGKSSILEMIEAGFEKEERILCIKFNGWRFQGFEDAKIALIEGIVSSLIEKRPLLTKAGDLVKETFNRINWLKVAKKGGGLAWTAFTGLPSPDQVHSVIKTLQSWMSAPEKLATKENIGSIIDDFDGLLKPKEPKHLTEEIREFRRAFNDLLEKAQVDQLIVLIDDLDRCLPDTAIETLEAIRLFVFTERTAFIVAADEAMIEYAVRKHFPDLPDSSGPSDYARNYLEKLIQIPFRIPLLGETETRIYVSLLLIGSAIGENDSNFHKVIEVARKKLKKPWASSPLDLASVKAIFPETTKNIQESIFISDQIGPILAAGTKGNPRQIKRFLNAIVLRMRIAEARGFGDEISLPILAKLMLAERFLTTLFDHIASSVVKSSDGTCSDVRLLEQALMQKEGEEGGKSGEASPKNGKDKKDKIANSENQTVKGWLMSDSICSWAAIEPKLTGVDLRPYLFVAKEKKDYFAGSTALGKLAIVAERLMGPKISIQGMLSELKTLPSPEASQVFEEVRSRIIGKATLDTQPPGVDGLIALASIYPNLQLSLCEFLESLPSEKIGAWVVSGWSSVFKDPHAVDKFNILLQRWASVDNNTHLKAAATATLSTKKKSI